MNKEEYDIEIALSKGKLILTALDKHNETFVINISPEKSYILLYK